MSYILNRLIVLRLNNMRRVHIIITGDVQGVGFRAWLKNQARQKEIFGWVKNREDGTIEAVFEGEAEQVKALLELCYTGPDVAWVDDIKIEEQKFHDEFTEFSVVG